MPLTIVRGKISQIPVHAIVEPVTSVEAAKLSPYTARQANFFLSVLASLRSKKDCPTQPGQAVLVKNHSLGAKQLIRTLLPARQEAFSAESSLLEACYSNALQLAKAHSLESVAIPLLVGASPAAAALQAARKALAEFLSENEMDVFLVLPEQEHIHPESSLLESVREYIDLCSSEMEGEPILASISPALSPGAVYELPARLQEIAEESRHIKVEARREIPAQKHIQAELLEEVEGRLTAVEETFSECILRLISERKMTEVETYKKANLDRKLFSKIRSNKDYTPSKATALALAIALQLDLEETEELLLKAGLALSHSYKFDIIVEYFILEERYDIFEINELLFAYDQPLLGAR